MSKTMATSGLTICRLSRSSVERSGSTSNEKASWLPSRTGALPVAKTSVASLPSFRMIDETSA